MTKSAKWGAGLFALMVAGGLVNNKDSAARRATEAAMTPAERSARDSIKRHSATMDELRQRERDVIYQAKGALTARLKDPESVRFGKVSAAGDSFDVACGEYNAKNGFGGYGEPETFVGNAKFVLTESDVIAMKGAARAKAKHVFMVCDSLKSITNRRR